MSLKNVYMVIWCLLMAPDPGSALNAEVADMSQEGYAVWEKCEVVGGYLGCGTEFTNGGCQGGAQERSWWRVGACGEDG